VQPRKLKPMEGALKTRGIVLAILLLNAGVGVAQVTHVTVIPLTDSDIKLLRQDIQADKDDIIKHTMQFSEAEAAAFWPIYKQYADQQRAIAEKRFAVILDYGKQFDTLTDDAASSLTQRMLQVEDEGQSLRKTYFPKFQTALGARRAAKFYQVDNRLTMIVNVQLASAVPLIP